MKHRFNEDVDRIIAAVVEAGEDDFKEVYRPGVEFKVYATAEPDAIVYNIQVPMDPIATRDTAERMVNKVTFAGGEEFTPDEMQQFTMSRMAALARSRNFPEGSYFATPWGKFRIKNKALIPA